MDVRASEMRVPVWRTADLADRLADFLSDQEGRRVEVTDLHRFTAGLSWFTASFVARSQDGAVRDLILRIGDPNGLLAPYSARPEYVALEALAGISRLPLPKAYWFSDDPSALDAPFLITERIVGETPLPSWATRPSGARAPECSPMLDDFVDALVAIHRFRWEGTEAESLSPGVSVETATTREVDRWIAHARPEAGQPRDIAMHFAGAWLKAHARPASKICLLHGDYRVGNFLASAGRIVGILDWELTHLGDPHEDLAWAGLKTFGGTDELIGGLFDRSAFYRQYEERSGFEIDEERLKYFQVLAQFKIASILIGAEKRVRQGKVHDARLAVMGLQAVPALTGLISLIKAAS